MLLEHVLIDIVPSCQARWPTKSSLCSCSWGAFPWRGTSPTSVRHFVCRSQRSCAVHDFNRTLHLVRTPPTTDCCGAGAMGCSALFSQFEISGEQSNIATGLLPDGYLLISLTVTGSFTRSLCQSHCTLARTRRSLQSLCPASIGSSS